MLIHCLQMTWILVSLSSISSLKLFKACHLQVFLKSQIIFKFSFISNLTISEVIKDLEVILFSCSCFWFDVLNVCEKSSIVTEGVLTAIVL